MGRQGGGIGLGAIGAQARDFEAFCRLGGCAGWFCLQGNGAQPRADRFQDGYLSATYDSVHRGRVSEHRNGAAYDFLPRR